MWGALRVGIVRETLIILDALCVCACTISVDR